MSATLNAYGQERPELRPMNALDLTRIITIEEEIYPFPWSSQNFADSLKAGYHAWVCQWHGQIRGYFVLMACVDEMHLLTIGVAKNHQGQGLGALLLQHALQISELSQAKNVLLEVRPSNVAALRLYRQFGFAQIGIRRHYYPAQNGREDALVLSRQLDAERSA